MKHRLIALIIALVTPGLGACSSSLKGAKGPPDVPREFRGAWVASVANIDWPSEPGLSVERQQAELIAILDKAVELNLNAIVLQVRPAGDALYDSPHEPWSEYLTGTQGRAPEPYYDPLTFAVEQAHRRGLELHAWFNPYRVGHPSRKGEFSPDHISNTRPDLVRQYQKLLWLDPGEPEVLEHSIRVILDMVERYDIDGVHYDDYFYPYPRRDDAGNEIPFPDDASYQRYRDKGGRLDRGDWRRRNVDRFVKRLYKEVKRTKPHVLVGISPFGIWKPGHPPQVKGMNQYERIYADARKWLRKGWCDYFTPQLYWPIAKPQQSFVALLQWWRSENPRGRHIWPGLFTSRTVDGSAKAFNENEVLYQIEWTRWLMPDDPGNVQFSFKALQADKGELATNLRKTLYREPALVPASKWLGARRPRPPAVEVRDVQPTGVELTIRSTGDTVASLWLVQARHGDQWTHRIVPATEDTMTIPRGEGDAKLNMVVVRAVGRTGRLSAAVTEPL